MVRCLISFDTAALLFRHLLPLALVVGIRHDFVRGVWGLARYNRDHHVQCRHCDHGRRSFLVRPFVSSFMKVALSNLGRKMKTETVVNQPGLRSFLGLQPTGKTVQLPTPKLFADFCRAAATSWPRFFL